MSKESVLIQRGAVKANNPIKYSIGQGFLKVFKNELFFLPKYRVLKGIPSEELSLDILKRA